MNTHFVRIIASFLFFVPLQLAAQGYSTIEIGNVQLSRSLAATVQDQQGFPIEGVVVEEFGSGWKAPLRSTKTDSAGSFNFSSVQGREIYYFELRKDGFDPLRVRVKVNGKLGKKLKLQLTLAS